MSRSYPDTDVSQPLTAPPGFALYRTETTLDPYSVLEIFLSVPLKERLDEEKRARKLARDEARRIEQERLEAARTAAAGRSPDELDSAAGAPETDAMLIAAFESEVAQRDRTRRYPVLRGSELVRVAAQIQTMRDTDYQKRDLRLIEKLKEMGALRDVANPHFNPSQWAESLGELRYAYPHFRRVTDFVARCVTLSSQSRRPLRIPPIHLWGEPGLGKTKYANDLAAALGAPIRRQSMENAQTTALLLGAERYWSTSAVGIIFDQVVLGACANPVFLLDEIDKVGSRGQYDPLAALHSLLEPTTANKVRDAALDIEFDASLATFIATSNDPSRLPASLLSRFREFEIRHLRGEEALRVARVVASSAVDKAAVVGFAHPSRSIAHRLAHLTPREIHHVIQEACARAIEDGRMALTLADLPADIRRSKNPGGWLH